MCKLCAGSIQGTNVLDDVDVLLRGVVTLAAFRATKENQTIREKPTCLD
jgi:hypothetical protein